MKLFTYKKIILAILGALVLLGPTSAFAQIQPYGELGGPMITIVGTLAWINTFMHILLIKVLQMLGLLLQADFFTDPIMMERLNSIWRLSRDVMNIIFALALIVVAFYTIITAKTSIIKEKYAHFIIAVVLVNFSWFFPRVIIDVANIATATVYSLPNALPGFTCEQVDANNEPVPCEVLLDAAFSLTVEGRTKFCNDAKTKYGDKVKCEPFGDFAVYVTGTWKEAEKMQPASKVLNGMAVSFAKILWYVRVPASIPESTAGKVTMDIAMSVLMSFIVQLAVLLALIGLGVGLFIRIIVMWMCVAFMPFTFLGYVKDGKLGTKVFGFEVDIWTEFINAAFLPAVVGIPLSVGFIMLGTVASIPDPTGATFDLPLIPGVQSWFGLLWIFAAVGIIWKGTFSALKKSQLIGAITEKIRGVGEQAFGAVARAPLLIPLPLQHIGVDTVGDLIAKPKQYSRDMIAGTALGETHQQVLARMSASGLGPIPRSQQTANGADLARSMEAEVQIQRTVVSKLEDIKREIGNRATPAQKVEVVRNQFVQMRSAGIMPNITDDKDYARQLIEMEKTADAGVKRLIADMKVDLDNVVSGQYDTGAAATPPKP